MSIDLFSLSAIADGFRADVFSVLLQPAKVRVAESNSIGIRFIPIFLNYLFKDKPWSMVNDKTKCEFFL